MRRRYRSWLLRGVATFLVLMSLATLTDSSGLPVPVAAAIAGVGLVLALRTLRLGVVVSPDLVVMRNVFRSYRLRAGDVAAADLGAVAPVSPINGGGLRSAGRALRVVTRDGRVVVSNGVPGRSAESALAALHEAMPWTREPE